MGLINTVQCANYYGLCSDWSCIILIAQVYCINPIICPWGLERMQGGGGALQFMKEGGGHIF